MTEKDETKAMSRLLTRGAKMLQKGCDDCGNPLFRYRGEVVCPVCNERRAGDEDKGQASGGKKTVVDATEADEPEGTKEGGTDKGVNEHLGVLARRLARDAAERSEDPEAVKRRLEALERTIEVLERAKGPQS